MGLITYPVPKKPIDQYTQEELRFMLEGELPILREMGELLLRRNFDKNQGKHDAEKDVETLQKLANLTEHWSDIVGGQLDSLCG